MFKSRALHGGCFETRAPSLSKKRGKRARSACTWVHVAVLRPLPLHLREEGLQRARVERGARYGAHPSSFSRGSPTRWRRRWDCGNSGHVRAYTRRIHGEISCLEREEHNRGERKRGRGRKKVGREGPDLWLSAAAIRQGIHGNIEHVHRVPLVCCTSYGVACPPFSPPSSFFLFFSLAFSSSSYGIPWPGAFTDILTTWLGHRESGWFALVFRACQPPLVAARGRRVAHFERRWLPVSTIRLSMGLFLFYSCTNCFCDRNYGYGENLFTRDV